MAVAPRQSAKSAVANPLSIVRGLLDTKYGADKPYATFNEMYAVPKTSSGSLRLDWQLGGGLADGKIYNLYGPESCLHGDSFLHYEVWKDGKRVNHKGGSIRRLFERFKGIDDGDTKVGRHLQIKDADYYVKSVNDENMVIKNKILDVVKTGSKLCFKVTLENGFFLVATKDHKFMTPKGFIKLENLQPADEVYVHDNTRVKGRKIYSSRPEVMVKFHPHLPTKVVRDNGKDYIYYRGQVSRIVYEAYLNNLAYADYVAILNSEEVKSKVSSFKFIPTDLHVHHIDENFLNNSLENLQLIDPREHGQLHAEDRIRNLSFISIPKKIISIEQLGDFDTYDIKCDYPYNNYIANGIVVHNCGKTAVASMIASTYQQSNLPIMWGDAENAFDPIYSKKTFNFDATDSSTVLYMPEQSGSILYSTAEVCAKNGFKLIVIDSTDAMLTSAEVESEYGDAMMAQKARLNSISLAKLVGILSKHGCSLILISQERMKMSYGGGFDISGGKAIKYYSSVRLRMTKLEMLKEKGNDDVIGQKINILCQKNKLGIPFRNIEMNLYYNKGFDKTSELVDLAVELEVVRSAGAWCYLGEEKWNGKAKFAEWLNAPEQDKVRADLEVTVRATLTNSIKATEVETPVLDPTKAFETDIEKELKASDRAVKEKKQKKESFKAEDWDGGEGE